MGELRGSAPAAMRAHLQHLSGEIQFGNMGAIAQTLEQQNRQLPPGHPDWLNPAQLAARAQQLADTDRHNLANQLIQQRAAAGGPAMTNQELNDAVNANIAQRSQRAAVQLLEAHTLLSHGINADSGAVINQHMSNLGWDERVRPYISAEDFLAYTAGLMPHGQAPNGAGNALRSQARTYDAQQHPGVRQVIVQVPAPAPNIPFRRGAAGQAGLRPPGRQGRNGPGGTTGP